MIYWHIRMHRWKFTTCAQQRHGTNCVLANIGTNHYFAIIWCRNRALDEIWDEIVLLILLQMWSIRQMACCAYYFGLKQQQHKSQNKGEFFNDYLV